MPSASRILLVAIGILATGTGGRLPAQMPAARPIDQVLPMPGGVESHSKVMPINLGSALQLAGARPLDIEVAVQRLQIAFAELSRANTLWLPTVYLGTDYFRHDGQ